MTYRLRVECIGLVRPCVRVLAMDSEASLAELHELIQKAVSFDRDHLYDFCIARCDVKGERPHWASILGDWDEDGTAFAKIRLKDIWPLGRKKLYYLFDFGDSWMFVIHKLRPGKADAALTTPSVVARIGPNPRQYGRT